jgi:hypothetical protein
MPAVTGQQNVVVTPAAANHLNVAGYPSPVPAGTSGTVTVSVVDAYGNVVPSYTGTVHLSSSDPQAMLPADYTFTAADNGMHAFNNVVLVTAGTQSITATDTVTASITGAQTGIVVLPGAATAFRVSGMPGSMTAGTATPFMVTAKDLWGNTVTGYQGTVHFSTSDPIGSVPADYTFTAADNGAHMFSATLKQAGMQTVSATDTTQSALNGQGNTLVNAAAASQLIVSGFPSPAMAGTPYSFTVTAYDAYGNVATGYRGTVHFTSSDGIALLPQDYVFTAADAGQHTFNATLSSPGSQWIDAIDMMVAALHGRQDGIIVQ